MHDQRLTPEQAALWRASEQRHAAAQDAELRAAWLDYHAHLAAVFTTLAESHAAIAAELRSTETTVSRGGRG